MYNARSRVVHRTHAQQQLVWCCQGRRPAFPGPAPVRHHRIHQGGDDHGVHGVCLELEALRDRTRDNGGARGRKGEGVEPLGVLVSLVVERICVVDVILCENLRAERKVARADEFALLAVQKGKAEKEKRDRDDLLFKISAEGLDQLSRKEKKDLERLSKLYRNNV